MTAAEERRLATQVDPGRRWPVVVTRRWSVAGEDWKPVLRAEAAAAVARYLIQHRGYIEEVAERAGELAVADQLRGGYQSRLTLTHDQLDHYAEVAHREVFP